MARRTFTDEQRKELQERYKRGRRKHFRVLAVFIGATLFVLVPLLLGNIFGRGSLVASVSLGIWVIVWIITVAWGLVSSARNLCCPVCGTWLIEDAWFAKYCPHCGFELESSPNPQESSKIVREILDRSADAGKPRIR